jgi:hypothetical protein
VSFQRDLLDLQKMLCWVEGLLRASTVPYLGYLVLGLYFNGLQTSPFSVPGGLSLGLLQNLGLPLVS